MNNKKHHEPLEWQDTSASGERRRLGRIVHDDRGTAIVEWHDAPAHMKREVLHIAGEAGLSIREEDSFNPYERVPSDRKRKTSAKRDLRKLSEWIKMMRELEQRKARGED